ncbi:hypothetical protein [Streptomyces sp. NBC_01435]|uniref:hypothetical protein n=1 Tax=Streptomyces sp. NBC_01435 TaxID=2903865 RepID=UPI002E3533A7|nr:hypothetical protein [Streptomyces sp. NBC_01435]
MERIYMNRRPAEQRIHVEIEAAEIRDLLADLALGEDAYQHGAARQLTEILRTADHAFAPTVPAKES